MENETTTDEITVSTNETQELEIDEYTNLFLQKKPSTQHGMILVFFLFFTVGAIQGYGGSIMLNLQAQGATMDDQAILSFIYYPYLFKLFFAPLIDGFFFREIGRSKSYIISSGFFISTVLLSFSTLTEDFLKEKRIWMITILWFFLNFVACFFQIASESWFVTLFNKDIRPKAVIVMNIGQTLGGMYTYNIFMPLNSVKWLNQHFFTKNPISTPLLSHSGLLISVALLTLATCSFALIFTAEKKMRIERKKGVIEIVKILPRFYSNPNMRKFLIYCFITNCFPYFYSEALTLSYINNGIDKTTLVNLSTFLIPISLVVSCLSNRFMKKEKLVTYYHLLNLFSAVTEFLNLIIFFYLERSHNTSGVLKLLYLLGILGSIGDQTFNFLFAKVNNIIDEELGSTSITVFTSISNSSSALPTTIGLKLVKYVNFHVFCWSFAIINLFILIAKFKFAKESDSNNPMMYSVSDNKFFIPRYSIANNGRDDNETRGGNEMFDSSMMGQSKEHLE